MSFDPSPGAAGEDFGGRPEDPRGRALFEELRWVHGRIRRDLDTVRRLARECLEGSPAAELAAELKRLETDGPLWKLKYNCLHYCSFVHGHHGAEDATFFPRVRRANPAIGPVIDRLEAEHREVSALLDRVELGAGALGRDQASGEEEAARTELSAALGSLAESLLAHLAFEEEQLEPTVARMPGLA